MVKNESLTVMDRLLLAAYSLDRQGKTTFTAEELVVSAWSMFPDSFGLKGFLNDKGIPLYPDSNRVFAEIMGSKPLRKRGFLSKTGPKQYSLTATGRERATTLESRSETASSQGFRRGGRSSLPRDYDRLLARMLSSRAAKKVRSGDLQALTFFDACMFWGITPQTSAINMSEKLQNGRRIIDESISIIGRGAVRIRNTTVEKESLLLLAEVDDVLRKRFREDLEEIANRPDEREWRH